MSSDGALLVADFIDHRIRAVTPGGLVSTLAGFGVAAYSNGVGISAGLNRPHAIAAQPGAPGVFFFADTASNRIRRLTSAGTVSTVAGNGAAGFVDGLGTAASFNTPYGLAVDGSGVVFVADTGNNRLRAVALSGMVTTLAGSGASEPFADGMGASATISGPFGVAVSVASGKVFVADSSHRIRVVLPSGNVSTLAGVGARGLADGAAGAAAFNQPAHLALSPMGGLIVADKGNNAMRHVSPVGAVTTLVGGGAAGWADGVYTAARFNMPVGVAVDANGTVYVGDFYNQRVRVLRGCTWPGGNVTGTATPSPSAGTATASGSPTGTPTGTGSPTGKGTSTGSPTGTGTPTPTPSAGAPPSKTPTGTPSSTATPTGSPTGSDAETPPSTLSPGSSASQSPAPSPTLTGSNAPSSTPTGSYTPSRSATPSSPSARGGSGGSGGGGGVSAGNSGTAQGGALAPDSLAAAIVVPLLAAALLVALTVARRRRAGAQKGRLFAAGGGVPPPGPPLPTDADGGARAVTNPLAATLAAPPPPPTPPLWRRCSDDTEDVWFVCDATGETAWVLPAGAACE